MIAQERIEQLEAQVRVLERRLSVVTESLETEKYARRVAEWALVGVARSQSHVSVAVGPGMEHSRDLLRAAEVYGNNAGAALLHHAKLAFRQHAEFAELKYKVDPALHAIGSDPARVPDEKFWPAPFLGPGEKA